MPPWGFGAVYGAAQGTMRGGALKGSPPRSGLKATRESQASLSLGENSCPALLELPSGTWYYKALIEPDGPASGWRSTEGGACLPSQRER